MNNSNPLFVAGSPNWNNFVQSTTPHIQPAAPSSQTVQSAQPAAPAGGPTGPDAGGPVANPNGGSGTTYTPGPSAADLAAAAKLAAKKQANDAAKSATQQTLDSLGPQLDNANKSIDSDAAQVQSKYDKESARNESDYNEQTGTNTNNRLKETQNALLAASQGRRGLMGTLASLGALNGDGQVLADRAVTQSANADIGGANDTAATNQHKLDRAIGDFRDENKDRTQSLQDQVTNNKLAAQRDNDVQRQAALQKMADLYGEMDDGAGAANYLHQAGDLSGKIAGEKYTTATPFAPRSAAFTPGKLSDYIAGQNDMTVHASDGNNTPDATANTNTLLAGRRDKTANTGTNQVQTATA